MNRGYVTAGEAGLIVFLVLMAAFIIALLIGAGKNADAQYINNKVRESGMCVISVTAPCGDDDLQIHGKCAMCLDALVKASKGGK